MTIDKYFLHSSLLIYKLSSFKPDRNQGILLKQYLGLGFSFKIIYTLFSFRTRSTDFTNRRNAPHKNYPSPLWIVRICCATTDNTSRSIRLNSSKQDQAPHEARPWNDLRQKLFKLTSVDICRQTKNKQYDTEITTRSKSNLVSQRIVLSIIGEAF